MTGFFDLYKYETREVFRLVIVINDLAFLNGKWISLDGFTIWEDD